MAKATLASVSGGTVATLPPPAPSAPLPSTAAVTPVAAAVVNTAFSDAVLTRAKEDLKFTFPPQPKKKFEAASGRFRSGKEPYKTFALDADDWKAALASAMVTQRIIRSRELLLYFSVRKDEDEMRLKAIAEAEKVLREIDEPEILGDHAPTQMSDRFEQAVNNGLGGRSGLERKSFVGMSVLCGVLTFCLLGLMEATGFPQLVIWPVMILLVACILWAVLRIFRRKTARAALLSFGVIFLLFFGGCISRWTYHGTHESQTTVNGHYKIVNSDPNECHFYDQQPQGYAVSAQPSRCNAQIKQAIDDNTSVAQAADVLATSCNTPALLTQNADMCGKAIVQIKAAGTDQTSHLSWFNAFFKSDLK